MPKVVVVDKRYPLPDDTAGWMGVRYARVSWNLEDGIQLATCDPRSGINERPYSTSADVNGLLVDLDRKTVNQLIGALKRARDAVYGGDE